MVVEDQGSHLFLSLHLRSGLPLEAVLYGKQMLSWELLVEGYSLVLQKQAGVAQVAALVEDPEISSCNLAAWLVDLALDNWA